VSQASLIRSLKPAFVSLQEAFGTVVGEAPRLVRVVATDAHEGPVYSPTEDALYYSSLPRPGASPPLVAVRRLALDGRRFPLEAERITTVRADANVANGMALDRDGRLVVCEQGTRPRAAAVTREGRMLASRWNGLPLNSPNDVVVKSDGSIWFTDPSYAHLQGFGPAPRLPDRVYRLDGELHAVAGGLEKPNGLAFSPDERVLYVGDSEACVIWALVGGERRLFADIAPGYPDGLKVDAAGRVWATAGDGVQIFDPDGRQTGLIPLPGAVNLAFGDGAVFITTDDAIWRTTT
jgi:gluconolactonase